MPALVLEPMQTAQLLNLLLAVFPNEATLEELLATTNRQFDPFRINGSTYKYNLLGVIKSAQQESWLHELIAEAINAHPAYTLLQQFYEALRAAQPLPDGMDPLDMCCLRDHGVMVNRMGLRGALKSLRGQNGARILLVRDKVPSAAPGPATTRTGKSQSASFVAELHRHWGDIELVFIDLGAMATSLGDSNAITPADIGEAVFRRLGYALNGLPAAPVDKQWSRWNLAFTGQLEAAGRADPRSVWIVIDEFNKVELMQASLDLIKWMAQSIETTLYRFRLVVLGFAEPFHTATQGHVLVDEIERSLSEQDVTEFFLRALEERRIATEPATVAERIVRAVAETLAGLDAANEGYLEEVGRRAKARLRDFGGGD